MTQTLGTNPVEANTDVVVLSDLKDGEDKLIAPQGAVMKCVGTLTLPTEQGGTEDFVSLYAKGGHTVITSMSNVAAYEPKDLDAASN